GRGEEDAAPGVQGIDAEVAAPRVHHQRRVDESHVPACVPTRVLVTRGEENASVLVERADDWLDRARNGDIFDGPADADASLGLVVGRGHDRASSALRMWGRPIGAT